MILDFGCGEGSDWLKRFGGGNTVGIDVDATKISRAKKLLQDGTNFIICDGKHLPFKDKCFTYIHIGGVLHHLPDFGQVLGEINRVLSGGLDIEEAVGNYPPFAIARRLVRKWQGCEIKSLFRSSQLVSEVENYFQIEQIEYSFLTLPSLLLSYFRIEPKICRQLNSAISLRLKTWGLAKYFAVWVKILAYNHRHPENARFCWWR